MIQFILFAATVIWFIFQFQPKATARWQARRERLKPLGRYLKADATCLYNGLRRPQRLVRGSRAPDYLPDEWGP